MKSATSGRPSIGGRFQVVAPIARVVRDPGNWPWSSYRAHAGRAEPPDWLDTPVVHGYLLERDAQTASERRRAAERYIAHVAAGRGVKPWDDALSGQIFLGDQAFAERMLALVPANQVSSIDIPRTQMRKTPKPIAQYLIHRSGRDVGIHLALKEGQHSMTAIAAELGISVSRVSRIVAARELLGDAES